MKLLNIVYIVISMVWIALCFTVFSLAGEGAIFPTIITTIISAPVGIIAMLIFSNLSLQIGGELATLVYIIISLILGYVQWFVLLPKIINYYKKRQKKNE